ncbi:MAG: sugar phosphate nucleotidyltransferase [Bacteroidota bacterium]|nr:sugar phosphate nucleotidyltransferase [Bacteroidota bacterium]
MSNHKASLVILAAGMGSRYGGLKQLDAFGPNGETIIDYSLYDALLAGFTKVVFIIRESFYKEFKEKIESRWKGRVEITYVFQELDMLPEGFTCPEERIKPWGTGHALWVTKDKIHEAFGVINADDYYGREAIKTLYDFLVITRGPSQQAVVAYNLQNTLSDHGAVNRGVCFSSSDGFLKSIKECKGITKDTEGKISYTEKEANIEIPSESLVSMNMWGFQTAYFDWAEKYLIDFLKKRIEEQNSEFYIPELIQYLIDRNEITVEILTSNSNWFGVTYQEDKPVVQAAFEKMISEEFYPNIL